MKVDKVSISRFCFKIYGTNLKVAEYITKGLDVTDESIMCIPCHNYHLQYSTLLNNCLNVETKIRKYCNAKGTNSKGQVQLRKVLHFTSHNVLDHQNNYSTNSAKLEGVCYEHVKNENMKSEIKNEGFVEMVEQELQIKEHNMLQMEQNNCDRYQDNFIPLESPEPKLTKPKAKRKKDIKQRIPASRGTSKLTMYNCNACEYQTRHKSHFRQHLLTHKNISEVAEYKCSICERLLKYKTSARRHMLTHKDAAEITMYKCNVCEYQSKYKFSLQQHMLNHKDASEIPMYKCDRCEYRSKTKQYIQYHILTHKDISEVTMYKCDVCEYQARYKRYLQRHMLSHKDVPEVTRYKCSRCDLWIKYKSNLKRHMLSHKDISEVKMYNCNVCEFQSKYKKSCERHMLTHEEASKADVADVRI